jgi:hypothetical protein
MPRSGRGAGGGGCPTLPCPPVAVAMGKTQVAALERQVRPIRWALDVMHAARLVVVVMQRLVDPLEAEATVRLGCEHLRLDPTPRCTTPAEVLRVATRCHAGSTSAAAHATIALRARSARG